MKILCTLHQDNNPSMHVYPEWSYCFVCGGRIKTETLGLKVPVVERPFDIDAMLAYIKTLTIKTVRGLQLPDNSTGYYIVWPNAKFYKKRMYSGHSRYIGPPKMRPPLFKLPRIESRSRILTIVEGELNALSLKEAFPSATIYSPGSATELMRHYNEYLPFKYIYVIVDKDAPGVAYGLQLRNRLQKDGKHAKLIAVEEDFNDVLVERGVEGLKETFKKEALGL